MLLLLESEIKEIGGLDPTIITALIAGAVAIFTNAGLWGILQKMQQHKYDKEAERDEQFTEALKKLEENQETMAKTLDLQGQVLKGIGHDRIIYLGRTYCKKGHISVDDYENLNEYLYKPYKELGGNGTAEKMMHEVDALPIGDDEEEDNK